MFVRWRRRQGTQPDKWARISDRYEYRDTRTAVLVKSCRIDGKPRQKFVAALGKIDAKHLDFYWEQCRFWKKIHEKLDTLAVTGEERARIIAALAAVVPIPTPEEAAEAERTKAEMEASLPSFLGRNVVS